MGHSFHPRPGYDSLVFGDPRMNRKAAVIRGLFNVAVLPLIAYLEIRERLDKPKRRKDFY